MPPGQPQVRAELRFAAGAVGERSLRIRLLGGMVVDVDGRVIPANTWPPKAARLVKLLALTPGHRIHRDQVSEELWPEFEPRAAANNLHRTLHAVRRVMRGARATSHRSRHAANPGEQHVFLALDHDLVSLHADSLWVDVQAFELAASSARAAGTAVAYETALDQYTGELLPEDLYDDRVAVRRANLAELACELSLELASIYERQAEYPAAIGALQRALLSEMTDEDVHVALMRVYALTQQPQRALRQFQSLREILWRELEVRPSAAAQRVYTEIRAGDFSAPHASARRRSNRERTVRPVDETIHLAPEVRPARDALRARPVARGGAARASNLLETVCAHPTLLTRREREVAGLVARGLTNRRIARLLGVSCRTIDTHLSNVFRKLGIESRTQLAAIRRGASVLREPV
jgi:DNA-binding SARP family transcriptional activator/DNA-binding CsgD family transcriptional regulator